MVQVPLKAIVLGASTGGPKALVQLFSSLSGSLGVPVFIVQHMPILFTETFAKSLDEVTSMVVKEAQSGDEPRANCVYVAPGGRQMKLIRQGSSLQIQITDEEPVNFCKPSADYFMNSVADLYGASALGVILSGMGEDGSIGLRKMKQRGSIVLGQDEETCVVYGMPRAAYEAGLVDKQVSIGEMAGAIRDVLTTLKSGRRVTFPA